MRRSSTDARPPASPPPLEPAPVPRPDRHPDGTLTWRPSSTPWSQGTALCCSTCTGRRPRLSGEAAFPAPAHDVIGATAWLRSNAETFGVDPKRIVLWGESAGGHLAALVGLGDPDVRAVVDWYGPSDLRTIGDDARASGIAATDPGAADSREALLLGEAPHAGSALAAWASPVALVHGGAPPFLLVHGTADGLVPHRQSERLAAALREHAVPVDLHAIEGADHLWRGSPDAARTAFDRSLAFLLDHA